MIRTLLLLALVLAASPAPAQPRYLPQPDTLYYEGVNPYRMYVVRGADTVGGPVRALTVERQVWRRSGEGLSVEVHQDPVDLTPEPSTEVLELTPRGEVTAAGPSGRWDFVLRLPATGELHEGRVWADTSGSVVDGQDGLQAWRELRVERITDTLGSRMAIIRGTGTMRFVNVQPAQEGSDAGGWLDVTGPVRETFLFDLRSGRMAVREWWMDLRGIGVFPAAGGAADTVPAGLFSSDTTRLVSRERARLITRGLPPGDTTATFGGMYFKHTVHRDGATLRSGFVRPDGMLTTVRATYRGGQTLRYEMLATEGLQEPVRRTVRPVDGGLRVEGGRDTVMPLPALPWAVADYAMHEHLGPALAQLARDGGEEARLAVFRPYPLRWDTLDVQLRAVDGEVLLATLRGGDTVEVLLLHKDGALLYVERVEPGSFQRRPRNGSEQAKRLDALIGLLLGEEAAAP
jgi:hypothetical protein